MKILFLMEKRLNAGSIHAVANYVRAADEAGHTIALHGQPDPRLPEIRFSTDIEAFDHLLFIVESGLCWMSALRMPRLLSGVDSERRAILDADGMYNELLCVDGYDRNHATESDRRSWLDHYELVSHRVFQPTVEPRDPSVRSLLFYGYDPGSRVSEDPGIGKRFDIVHLAHNWWRWREIASLVLPALERIRPVLDGVCFIGSWWNGSPPPSSDPRLAAAFQADSAALERLGIAVKPPVPYTRVIDSMSQGRVNLMSQRPLLRQLKLLTSKYFEVFCADTVPLLLLDGDQAEAVYGPAGRHLVLDDSIGEKVLDVLARPDRYREIVQSVRCHLEEHHSYRVRIRELVTALQTPATDGGSAAGAA